MMHQDNRTAVRLLALHTNDSESEDEDTENVFEKKKRKAEKETLLDLCPSWMGQVFQVQYILKVYI